VHESAMQRMEECIRKYMDAGRHYDVLDFGSFINVGQTMSHRELFDRFDCSITGVDIHEGRNVDVKMTKPYRIPLKSGSQDVVITGQVFEHIPFPFASMLEIARVLRPGGLLFMTVPSRGHRHSKYDLWRFYPDSMRAFAAYSDLELLEARTDWPPKNGRRHDYAGIDATMHYWGDTLGVFRKGQWRISPWRAFHRRVVTSHANRIGDLSKVPIPKPRKTRVPATGALSRP